MVGGEDTEHARFERAMVRRGAKATTCAYVVTTRELVQRNPGIEAAADDLCATASAVVAGPK